MSMGENAIGELPIAAERTAAPTATKTPRRRQTTAKADLVQQPEAR